MALWAASFSYCYSDTTYSSTNNAAAEALAWAMKNVLPDSTAPYISVEINGLAYQYTMVKDPEADATVTISNEDAANPGTNIFEETDDWSGNPGGTVRKYFRFGYIDSSRWGDGEISVEGEGTVTDPFVVYNYKMVVDDSFKCLSPLSDPSCPGYSTALAEYLASLAQPPSIGDPYYDEWVQAELNREANRDEEELEQADNSNEVEDDLEEQLGGNNNIDKLVDGAAQQSILANLSLNPKIVPYYEVTIPGGQYEDTLVLPSTSYPDNRRAMRNLASDANHRSMVRSQYER